jgi:3',5'-cyclic AMP phosphodiesterase CpdA
VRTIAHICDLHFGREDPAIVGALKADLQTARPDLVAVSGDLTQRARRREFAAARDFLSGLGTVVVAVPGNHDIPLFDLARRVFQPLERYRRYIQAETDPFYLDGEMAVLGLNTARRALSGDGRLSRLQIELLVERLSPVPGGVAKIVITHHPFLPARSRPFQAPVGRGPEGLQAAEAAGVDLLLTGHLHRGFTDDVRRHHAALRRGMVVVQAGTTVSRRLRGEPNSYNVIRIDPPRLECTVRSWDGRQFRPERPTRYVKADDGWRKE